MPTTVEYGTLKPMNADFFEPPKLPSATRTSPLQRDFEELRLSGTFFESILP